MQGGLLVLSWPWVVGCDAAGVVVKVGEKAASSFKEGDEVCGCTRLGSFGYSTCQEYVSPGLSWLLGSYLMHWSV